MCTMRLLLCLVLFWNGSALASSAAQAEPSARSTTIATPILRHAGLMDYVLGSRARLIQVATIAFGIGLVILLTSTRKH